MCQQALEADAVFYYADEFNVSWQPTLKAMWSPVGQQVMITTPGQTNKRFGIGAVNYHTGETVVILRKRKRQDRTTAVANRGATDSTAGGLSNSNDLCGLGQRRHARWGEIDAVLLGAAGRLVLLYLPTYSPWLNPINGVSRAMLWRHWRKEVTHCDRTADAVV